MDFLQKVLWPLTSLLRLVLEAIVPIVHSYGLAVMLLSILVSVMLTPITRAARRMEMFDKERQERMAPLIAEVRANYRGQDRFEKTDEIYQQFNYHPVKSMGSLLPLLVQLPFLLAALFLLLDYPPLAGQSFLFIGDLSRPDGAISLLGEGRSVNALPLILTLVAIIDSVIRPEATRQTRLRFLIVSAVLVILIYPFPAAVCLYWLTSNLVSLIRSIVGRFRRT